ncbi:MAG: twin-arginine translocase subunit TatC [Terriglobia bacterium]
MRTEDHDERELEESGKMSFLEHLEELRRRLIVAFSAVGIAFLLCWAYAKEIYHYLAIPITQNLSGGKLVFTNPTDPFTIYMKVAFIAGIFVASPVVLWQVWLFVSPGLYRREKKYAFPFIFFTSLLFILGGIFAYKIAFPLSLKFLIGLGEDFQPMVTITEYFDLALVVILGCGIIFEIPILIFFLTILGVVNARFLFKNLRYAILIIFIAAAVLTPTSDIPNMLIFAMPMLLLYLVGILVSWIFGNKRKKKLKSESLEKK